MGLCLTKACREQKQALAMAELDIERQKLGIMTDIASQPATGNKALIIIPIAILAFGAITAFVLIRKKKK